MAAQRPALVTSLLAGLGSSSLAIFVLVVCAALSGLAVAQPSDGDADSAEQLAPPPPPSELPRWNWSQILSTPHISARMTSVAVNPRDGRRIYVGTDSGAVFGTDDGGITWRELSLRPILRSQRDVPGPSLPRDLTDYPRLFHLPRPPYRPSSPIVALFEVFPRMTPWEQWPQDIFRFYVISDFLIEYSTLLGDAIQGSRPDPVTRISVCPGARYPLYVATASELFASDDDGYTFVPVLRNPDEARIHQVVCHRDRPNHIVVATDRGAYYSVDGGATFEPGIGGYLAQRVQAIDIADDGEMLVASGFRLFRGRPQSGFERLYPDPRDTTTAPWGAISWIARDGPEIWLATGDGVRRSTDNGATWENVAPNLFSRQWVTQVRLGHDEYGRRHVAVLARWCPPSARTPFDSGCRMTEAFVSTDGQSWAPFFADISRRSVQQMAYSPGNGQDMTTGRWFVATGGELWANSQAGVTVFAPETRAWAQRRLAATPAMNHVLNAALEPIDLRVDDINETIRRARRRALGPRSQIRFDIDWRRLSGGLAQGPNPLFRNQGTFRTAWFLLINFQWTLPEFVQTRAEVNRTRENLNAMRERVSFVVEDAWHERQMHLRRLQLGTNDLLQAEILRERILVLESILSFWLRKPLEAVN